MANIFKRLYDYWAANFSFRNVYKFSNFLKLGFIYIVAVFWVIIVELEFSENFWTKLLSNNLSSYRITIYTSNNTGEAVLANRIRKVTSKMGIDYYSIIFNNNLSNFWLTRGLYYSVTNLVNYLFKPNFNLAVTHHVSIVPIGYNITYLNVPPIMLYDISGKFKPELRHLKEYDAYADLYSFVHGENKNLNNAIKLDSLQNKKIIPIYMAQEFKDYSPPGGFKQALITGSLWGCNRNSLRITNALKMLAAEDLLIAYGSPDYFKELGEGYKGSFDRLKGALIDNLHTIQKEYGIALVIHSLEHMIEGIPTSRIMEASASGALVICDQHYFIKKFFGDNVLYIDTIHPEEQIYKQVKAHILWAHNNPAEAQKKAKAAYEIFAENFIIEKQFKFLIDQLNY